MIATDLPRRFKTAYHQRRAVKERRDFLRAVKLCINGPLEGNTGSRGVVHGPVVQSGRCQRCLDVKRGKAS